MHCPGLRWSCRMAKVIIDARKALRRLANLAKLQRKGAKRAAAAAAVATQRTLQRQILAGQVVARDSGKLQSNWRRRRYSSQNVEGQAISTTTPYAAAHHYGINRGVAVRGYARRISSRSGDSGFTSFVRPHIRRMSLRPRKFLTVTKHKSRRRAVRSAREAWGRTVAN